MVNIADMTRVISLREQKRPVKHVSFDHSGSLLAVSCSDGVVYIYSVSTEQPELVQRLDGLVKVLETDAIESAGLVWHPDGRAFVAPTPTRSLQVVSRSDWQNHRSFPSGHSGDITAAAWTHNGALLASAGNDRSLTLWNTKTQEIIKKFDSIRQPIVSMSWHPTENVLSYANNDGELYIHTDFIPSEHLGLLQKTLQAAPLRGEPLSEVSGNAQRGYINGAKENEQRRAGTPDSLDDILGLEPSEHGDEDDFIIDDDGAGYAEFPNGNGHAKRPGDHLVAPQAKRYQSAVQQWRPQLHAAFQPGSTPWRGDRRYLCLNLTGFIWTNDQGDHHTISIEFYDRATHRNVHFTDPFLWDKACLTDHGAAFTCPATSQTGCTIYYRPHETWTTKTDWRTTLPAGEEVTSLSLSSSYVVVTTTKGYVRIYTLWGVPFRIYRSKSPVIASTSWRDYIFTVSNGPISPSGSATLIYSIDNVKRDETCQSDDILPLPSDGTSLSSIFFSARGDPCIYDSAGVLLPCLHWRTPGQAKWVPLLDTRALERLASGRKDESYWPVAVADERFHCIILKGGDKHPHFPSPLLTDFPLRVPVAERAGDDDEAAALQEQFVRLSALHALHEDLVAHTKASSGERAGLARRAVDADKVLLQMLAGECREGEERGMRALEIVGLMRDRSGKMLEAAGKIAARFGRDVLGEKIEALAERRLVGLVDEEDM